MAQDFLDQLRADGVVRSPRATLTPLSGGVSSDIFLVDDDGRRLVVKRALTQLRVADHWTADASRSRFEHRYLRYVGGLLPEAVPRLLGDAEDRGYVVMEHLGEGFANWKRLLLDGRFDPAHAAQAGRTLGVIHRASAGDEAARRLFDCTENFRQLRIEPYLLTTGARHPPLRSLFADEADQLLAHRDCLVHGDYSPKNMLLGHGRLVVLDCETAWYGDGVFDLAFLLNHLFLKALYHRPRAVEVRPLVEAAWQSYVDARGVASPERPPIEQRLGRLLPMLLLARVDGKSPAEYLAEPQRQAIREFVGRWLPGARRPLSELTAAWFSYLAAVGEGPDILNRKPTQ